MTARKSNPAALAPDAVELVAGFVAATSHGRFTLQDSPTSYANGTYLNFSTDDVENIPEAKRVVEAVRKQFPVFNIDAIIEPEHSDPERMEFFMIVNRKTANPMTARLLTRTQLEQLVNEAQARFPADDRLTVAEWVAYLDNQDMIEKVGDKYRLSGKITQEDVRDALYASGGHRLYSNPSSESHIDYARTYLDRSRYYEQKGDVLNAYDAAVKAVANLEEVIREADAPVEARPLYQKCEKQQRNLRKTLLGFVQETAKPKRSNPSPLEHMDLARHYLMASQDNEDDPWKAYDFTVMALTEATNADEYDVPGAKLMLNQLQGRRIALKDALRGGGKVSNPRHGGAHYFVVLDKKGKQQFYTQTAAEARELLASNAKVRGGSYKHL